MYAIAFPLQVYFDFSGYSDMAIGLGKMLGFSFPENINYPFISRTVTEFWRRWHITLGGWFRDYLYIPLGGNRVSGIKWVRNIAIVWLATGIWHGAAWNFALWGLFFGIVLIAEKLWLLKRLEKTPKWIGHFYTLILVVLSFVIFNGDGLLGVVSDFKGLLGLEGLPFVNNDTIYYLKSYGVVFAVGIIGATPLPKKMWLTLCSKKGLSLLEPIGAMIILVVSTAFIVNGSFNPFLYFRF